MFVAKPQARFGAASGYNQKHVLFVQVGLGPRFSVVSIIALEI